MKRSKPVDLSKYPDLDIKAFVMSTLDAKDQTEAALRVLPMNGKPMDGNLFSMLLTIQHLAQSITQYTRLDGVVVKCAGPCLEVENWSVRTRTFLETTFGFMNGVSKSEHDDFLAALAGADSAQPTSTQEPSSGT